MVRKKQRAKKRKCVVTFTLRYWYILNNNNSNWMLQIGANFYNILRHFICYIGTTHIEIYQRFTKKNPKIKLSKRIKLLHQIGYLSTLFSNTFHSCIKLIKENWRTWFFLIILGFFWRVVAFFRRTVWKRKDIRNNVHFCRNSPEYRFVLWKVHLKV